MGLARPYFDRNHFVNWTHDQLIDALVEAKTRALELDRSVRRLEKHIEKTEDGWS
jgi:hypothetical protein